MINTWIWGVVATFRQRPSKFPLVSRFQTTWSSGNLLQNRQLGSTAELTCRLEKGVWNMLPSVSDHLKREGNHQTFWCFFFGVFLHGWGDWFRVFVDTECWKKQWLALASCAPIQHRAMKVGTNQLLNYCHDYGYYENWIGWVWFRLWQQVSHLCWPRWPSRYHFWSYLHWSLEPQVCPGIVIVSNMGQTSSNGFH